MDFAAVWFAVLVWGLFCLYPIGFLLAAVSYAVAEQWSRLFRLIATVPVWALSLTAILMLTFGPRLDSTLGQALAILQIAISFGSAIGAWRLLFRSIGGIGWFQYQTK